MKNLLAGVIAVCCALTAAACGSDRPPSLAAPSAVIGATANRTAGGAGSAPSLVGTWRSTTHAASAAATISLAVCSNIQMNITSQTATQASGILSMDCPDNVSISGTLVGQLGAPTIPLSWNGTATQPGFGSCAFSMTGTGTPLGGEMFQLTYSGNSCQGAVQGSDTLRFVTPGTPTPPATPPPGTPRDGIDMSRAVIRNSPLTLGSWPITTGINVVELRPTGVHLDFSKQNGPDRWPDVVPPGWSGGLQWTLGMALNIGGQWFASAPVQFWHGLEEAGGPPQDYALNWFYDPARWAPMTGHQPVVGETIGIFACAGDCRNNTAGSLSPVKERSNVVLVTFPGPGGARFTF
jgi:hypothetical protein